MADAGRIEMYLVSRRAQTVPIDALGLRVPFAAGEALHTEDSYEYSLDEIRALAAAAGFEVERQWLDEGRRFAQSLYRPLVTGAAAPTRGGEEDAPTRGGELKP